MGLLKNVLRMWLLDTLAAEFRVEQEKRAEGDDEGPRERDGAHANDLDRERAESLFTS
jgi:hypothetical protein